MHGLLFLNIFFINNFKNILGDLYFTKYNC